MTEKEYAERCVRQYKAHTKTLSDGAKLIRIESGLWDYFSGNGWGNHSRFRLFKLREDKTPRLICVSGMHMSPDLRNRLIKECGHG